MYQSLHIHNIAKPFYPHSIPNLHVADMSSPGHSRSAVAGHPSGCPAASGRPRGRPHAASGVAAWTAPGSGEPG